ncbi:MULTISPECIES: carbon-nitrogen hydrolase family protein [Alphaproteobacteria]|uniref:Hydrolase n=2 Tax=Alphaproteobacteria TaxID=28211 RepID=A0A512HJ52_9HYPH|nr:MULTISPECIES: carbon-nitrogen hydrolase family protein [Alphaproteobacteria]GEO85474.1 hydrolase [Ciceribacter naphthalenivorans]GLR21504.1 hydrolase [Ciceribacter naphthalenivorans]GLT04360.1 hydrolase [Sphingomonas psychrolutea]
MLISLYQMQPISGDAAGNLSKIAQAAAAASDMGADLLVTPELSVSGYALSPAQFSEIAEGRDGDIIGALREIAAEFEIAVCAGFPERDGDVVYNSAVLVRPEGGTEFYRKTHLYGDGERAAFAPGTEGPCVFDFAGIRTGMLICYDVEFPEYVRSLALAGAELVLVPTALPAGIISRRVADMVVPTRAFENGLFIAYADLCGEEGALSYSGRSAVVGPDGDELARAGLRETLLVSEIDPTAYDDCRKQNPYLIDRRPDLYRLG